MNGFFHQARDGVNPLQLFLAARDGSQRGQVDPDGGQGLSQTIMQLPGQRGSFFFPYALQPGREGVQFLERTLQLPFGPLAIGNILQDDGYAIDAGRPFDGKIRHNQVPQAAVWIRDCQLVFDDFALEALIHFALDDPLEQILAHYFRDQMANDLFLRQALIVEVRLIRNHVTVVAADNPDHFLQALDDLLIFPQLGFRLLTLGDVFDNSNAKSGAGFAFGACRSRDPYPDRLAVFTPIALFQLEVR